MPGLRGNLCWGNRGSFSIYGEYPSTGLDASDVPYVSTNAYYGHHKIPLAPATTPQKDDEDMDTSEAEASSEPLVSRKRLSNEQWPQVLHKRIRQGENRNTEEEDLLFMEHYLKQTHGCDYYSYKSSY